MYSEEEKEAFKVLKDLLLEFEDVEKWVIVNFSKKEFESLRICVNLIEKQRKELEREKQYTDFYKDLCDKQQKEIEDLYKHKADNDSYKVSEVNKYVNRILEGFVSKAKIRAKIKELEDNKKIQFLNRPSVVKQICLNAFRELLEENNNE